MKICTKCKEEKPYESFHRNKNSSDGLTQSCKMCNKERSIKWNKDNVERHRERTLAWQKDNPEKYQAKSKRWYRENVDKCREWTYAWKEANPAKVTAIAAKRRASKSNATPSWLTQEHYRQIDEVYWLAKDLEIISGQPYHVDHIVPLQGKNVCGLHVPWNLQVLPSDINIAKSNTHVA